MWKLLPRKPWIKEREHHETEVVLGMNFELPIRFLSGPQCVVVGSARGVVDLIDLQTMAREVIPHRKCPNISLPALFLPFISPAGSTAILALDVGRLFRISVDVLLLN